MSSHKTSFGSAAHDSAAGGNGLDHGAMVLIGDGIDGNRR